MKTQANFISFFLYIYHALVTYTLKRVIPTTNDCALINELFNCLQNGTIYFVEK